MRPVGALGKIRIFPDYRAQESPRTLICGDPCLVSVSIRGDDCGRQLRPCLAHPSLFGKSTTN